MRPDGNGKLTLLSTIMEHPSYNVKSGNILIDDKSILEKQ